MRTRFVTRQLAAAVVVALLCQGCALSFLDNELNNRGGYADHLGDRYWIVADTKPMRMLRAYVLIGSLLRMSKDNFSRSEREVLIQHSNSAIFAANDAFACAYDTPGRCVYFDERIVEFETSVLRLANSVFTTKENETLFSTLSDQFNDTIPLLKGVNTLTELVDALSSTGQLAVNATKLVSSLITVGKSAAFYGTRIGALYRDSIELEMVTVIRSYHGLCFGFTPESDSASKVIEQFQAITSQEQATACNLHDEGMDLWKKGAGDFAGWKTFLHEKAVVLRAHVVPHKYSFMQASDLIWRACEQLTDDQDLEDSCIGFRKPRKNDPKGVKVHHLLAYNDTKDMREQRSQRADTRIGWLSNTADKPRPFPNNPGR